MRINGNSANFFVDNAQGMRKQCGTFKNQMRTASSKPVNLYLNTELVKKIREIAEGNDMSLSSFIEKNLRNEIKNWKRRKAA